MVLVCKPSTENKPPNPLSPQRCQPQFQRNTAAKLKALAKPQHYNLPVTQGSLSSLASRQTLGLGKCHFSTCWTATWVQAPAISPHLPVIRSPQQLPASWHEEPQRLRGMIPPATWGDFLSCETRPGYVLLCGWLCFFRVSLVLVFLHGMRHEHLGHILFRVCNRHSPVICTCLHYCLQPIGDLCSVLFPASPLAIMMRPLSCRP